MDEELCKSRGIIPRRRKSVWIKPSEINVFFLFYIILRKPNPMTDNVSLFVPIFPSAKNAYLYVNRLHLPALCGQLSIEERAKRERV